MPRNHRSNLPASQGLPRQIYWIIIGLSAWLVVSVWGFLGTGYSGLALAVVSLFIFVVVGLMMFLGAIAERHRPRGDHAEAETLSGWLGREFEAHTGPLRGTTAAVQVLLPIVAVAFGMTIFAIVHHLDGLGA